MQHIELCVLVSVCNPNEVIIGNREGVNGRDEWASEWRKLCDSIECNGRLMMLHCILSLSKSEILRANDGGATRCEHYAFCGAPQDKGVVRIDWFICWSLLTNALHCTAR